MNGKLLKDDKKPPVMHLVIKHRWETWLYPLHQ